MKSLIKSIFLVFALGFLTTFIFRLVFYFSFKDLSLDHEFSLTFLAFIHGIRFDLSALILLNLIFFVSIYFKSFRTHKLFLNLWAIVNLFYLLILASDFTYYSLYSSKLGWDFLAAFNGLSIRIFLSMSYQFMILIPIFFALFFIYRMVFLKLFLTNNVVFKISYFPIYFFILITFGFIGYRGGFQKRVLSPQHTWLYSSGSAFYATLTSNPLHNLMRSKKGASIPDAYKNTKQSYLPKWSMKSSQTSAVVAKKPKNVLFIFIESLSSYPFDNNHLPEFKSWSKNNKKDIQFSSNFYANGSLSKDALLSVFFGLPSYFNIHYFESKYSKNNINGIGQIAKKNKMDTFFLHAAPAGTQFFDVISKAAGFENYISIHDQFKGEPRLKGTWGVHDEVLYDESNKYISNLKKPFIGTVFTTSTHTPFRGTPNNPSGKGSEESNYFLALQYADKALVNFFNEASKTDWFKDTLFVVTGDHSPPLSADWNRKLEELSRIPVLFFWPNSNLGEVKFKNLGRHVDIPKTVFQLLGIYPENWTPYGESLIVSPNNQDTNVFYTNSNTINLVLEPKRILSQSIYDNDTKFLNEELKNQKNELQIQKADLELKDYVFRLEKNSIYK